MDDMAGVRVRESVQVVKALACLNEADSSSIPGVPIGMEP